VKLKFVPIILGDGHIRLKVSPEVSDLDYGNGVTLNGFTVPGISQRKVTTTVELADGQSFALAGLLNTSVAANKNVTPLLGDLPIIGPLFRTVRYSRKETELVVLVTPHIVEPMNPNAVPRLPGEAWIMPTENELFMNAYLGGEKPQVGPATPGTEKHAAPKFHEDYNRSTSETQEDDSMDALPSIELLENTHRFPGPYMFKVIGKAENADFAARVAERQRDMVQAIILDTPPRDKRPVEFKPITGAGSLQRYFAGLPFLIRRGEIGVIDGVVRETLLQLENALSPQLA